MIAFLDPSDRVQPRSRTISVGWLARLRNTDAIHGVCPVPHHSVVKQGELSLKLEYQSSDSPFPFLPLCAFESLPAPFTGW